MPTATIFSIFFCRFLNPNYFFNLNSNCTKVLDLRNLQEQVKKNILFHKLFWPFNVQTNCSSDLKKISITREFFSHSRSEQFCKQNTIPTCDLEFWFSISVSVRLDFFYLQKRRSSKINLRYFIQNTFFGLSRSHF